MVTASTPLTVTRPLSLLGEGLTRTVPVFAWLIQPAGFVPGLVGVRTIDKHLNRCAYRPAMNVKHLVAACSRAVVTA